jgi:hypothetical protein
MVLKIVVQIDNKSVTIEENVAQVSVNNLLGMFSSALQLHGVEDEYDDEDDELPIVKMPEGVN